MNDSVRELTRYKDKPAPNKRSLQNKLDKVLSHKNNLIDKHYIYGEKASIELESEKMLTWLTPQLDNANNVADEVEVLIEDLESNEDAA